VLTLPPWDGPGPSERADEPHGQHRVWETRSAGRVLEPDAAASTADDGVAYFLTTAILRFALEMAIGVRKVSCCFGLTLCRM